MNRNILKKYAPEARRDFIQAVTDRASFYGITKKKTEPVSIEGDVAVITGRAFPKKVGEQRKRLEERVARQGFDHVMEAMAYTWFNRLVAIRFMELHGYLEHGYRVLSHPVGNATPEILEHADSVDLLGLDPQQVIDLKLAGDKDAELYRMLLVAQCNALHTAMPFLFERVNDETELLLPDNLLHSDSLIRTLVETVPEEDWQEVEIIGWLYQFYISEKKDEVIGKVVKSEDIPAATQLFTPNWIVKYLVQNSLGRQWMATYPNSPLKGQMEYYIEPVEQTPEVQEQLNAITPDSLNPEELTLLDPACGSGHILVEAYDLLKAIYLDRGFSKKDIPRLILEKNLHGLEIDDRAAQLAAFALMMKARADDRRIFTHGIQPHVLSIQESDGLDAKEITEALNEPILKTELAPSGELFEEIAEEKSPLFSKKNLSVKGEITQADVAHLIDLFEYGKTFGSLIQVPEMLAEKLPSIAQRVEDVIAHGGMFEQAAARLLKQLIEQARILAKKYDAVVMNPPYMGNRGMTAALKEYAKLTFPNSKQDLFSMFIERGFELCSNVGVNSMITMMSWMFLSSYSEFRRGLLNNNTLITLAHLGPRAFSEISGEVVQTAAFVFLKRHVGNIKPAFFDLTEGQEEEKRAALRGNVNRHDSIAQDHFARIPGSPIAYWVAAPLLEVFSLTKLGALTIGEGKNVTADNDRFLRRVWEVSADHIGRDRKWIVYAKGGEFRKWAGNLDFVCNWSTEARSFYRSNNASRIIDSNFWYLDGVTWTVITSNGAGFRYLPPDTTFDTKGLSLFFENHHNLLPLLGLLNSAVGQRLLSTINPSMCINTIDVKAIPVPPKLPECTATVESLVSLSTSDWGDQEIALGFTVFPALKEQFRAKRISESFLSWEQDCERRISDLQSLEAKNNRIFIEAYGLKDELSPDVTDDQITLCRPDQEEGVQRLISYAIGCMLGRYSLDKPGLIYAHSGGEDFDPSQYQTFPADEDGIIPITEFQWFEDDATNRVAKFIATAWPKEHLDENLRFVAESISQKKNESAREAVRRYLSTGFYTAL